MRCSSNPKQLGAPPLQLEVASRALRGGLESPDVRLVVARFRDARGRSRVMSFVIKRSDDREANVYRLFAGTLAVQLSPRLLDVEQSPEGTLLFLEAIPRLVSWPWKHIQHSQAVLIALAPIHRLATPSALALPPWDYETELSNSAQSTLRLAQQSRSDPGLSRLARSMPAIRRTVLHLPRMRRELLELSPLGTVAIHRDVHPGNALMRKRSKGPSPVLLDWGRARWGSPLEDASSWLQSLRYWEPCAARKHDTLLGAYLSELGRSTSEMRQAYWLAAASNALSGALRYHLLLAADAARDAECTRRIRVGGSRPGARDCACGCLVQLTVSRLTDSDQPRAVCPLHLGGRRAVD